MWTMQEDDTWRSKKIKDTHKPKAKRSVSRCDAKKYFFKILKVQSTATNSVDHIMSDSEATVKLWKPPAE